MAMSNALDGVLFLRGVLWSDFGRIESNAALSLLYNSRVLDLDFLSFLERLRSFDRDRDRRAVRDCLLDDLDDIRVRRLALLLFFDFEPCLDGRI